MVNFVVKQLHISLKLSKKTKKILIGILLFLFAVLLLPLPIPRFYTLTGKCMQHENEEVSIKVNCVELECIWMTDRLLGTFELTMDGEQPVSYQPMSGDGSKLNVNGGYATFAYQKETYSSTRNYFIIYAPLTLDSWVMQGYLNSGEHLLFVTKNGDIDQMIEEHYNFVEPYLRELEIS